MVSREVLIVAEPFGDLLAERVARALAKGLHEGERELTVDVLLAEDRPANAREWWRANVSGERLRAARALVIATARLDERTLAASLAFEAATDARQTGVPAYAVTSENELDRFDARMLDLQTIFEVKPDPRSLLGAGRKLAQIV